MFDSIVSLFLSIVNTFARIRCSCWPLLLPQLQLRAAAAISAAAAVHKDIRISPPERFIMKLSNWKCTDETL